MKVTSVYLYAALAVAVTAAYAVLFGSYWVTDAVVFSVVAGVVAWLCFTEETLAARARALLYAVSGFPLSVRVNTQQGAETTATETNRRKHLPRSRIAHYARLSKIKSTEFVARVSDSPFERALLGEPEWRTLSAEKLEEVSKKAPGTSARNVK